MIPCYNEEEVINQTCDTIFAYIEILKLKKTLTNYEIVLVDDGSEDTTWHIIESLKNTSSNIRGIKLTRNMGHQNALLAGLFNSNGDVTISIDADLQDDISVIEDMISLYVGGSEIVYGVRKKRDQDSFFKKFSAEGFYKLLSFMGVEIVFNHADYRLLSKKVIENLKDFKETNLFLRGLFPMIGYKTSKVYYDRKARFAGTSKYPLSKMLKLAIQAITSFSTFPLKIISVLGFLIFFISFIIGVWVIFVKFFTNDAIPGWASTALPIYFIGGIQLLSIGVIGEYIGKIYLEVKQRPRYIIEKMI